MGGGRRCSRSRRCPSRRGAGRRPGRRPALASRRPGRTPSATRPPAGLTARTTAGSTTYCCTPRSAHGAGLRRRVAGHGSVARGDRRRAAGRGRGRGRHRGRRLRPVAAARDGCRTACSPPSTPRPSTSAPPRRRSPRSRSGRCAPAPSPGERWRSSPAGRRRVRPRARRRRPARDREYVEQACGCCGPAACVAVPHALADDRVPDPARRDEVTTAMRELGRTVRDDERLTSQPWCRSGDGLLVAARR